MLTANQLMEALMHFPANSEVFFDSAGCCKIYLAVKGPKPEELKFEDQQKLEALGWKYISYDFTWRKYQE